MENILQELYWLCNEENIHKDSHNNQLQNALSKFTKCEDIFVKRLKGENLIIFNEMVDIVDEMTAHIAFDNFIAGTKIGAKLIFELLVD